LEAIKNNSKAIPKSSSIKLIGIYGFIKFSMSFKHIVMVDYTPKHGKYDHTHERVCSRKYHM
jgi:hypothetical protein